MLGGQFRVEQELGSGGMSVVYKCTDLAVQRKVAVKLLQPALASQDKWLLRFQQEAKATGRLCHPNIVRVHHFDAQNEAPFIVMDCIEGTSLADVIEKGGALDTIRAIRIMLQVADALMHAHSKGVTHRDLKPSNIMLVDEDVDYEQVKILDFGIAKICEPDLDVKLTQTGEIFGSPLFMSPEQCHGKQSDWRSDQYSFGCVLFECLTGCPPFTGDNPMSILIKQINEAPPSLKEASLGKRFPAELEELVQRMLEKEPDNRFGSMSDVKQALLNVLSPTRTKPEPATAPQPKKLQILKSQIILGTITLALLGLLIAYISWMLGPGSDKSQLPKEHFETISSIIDSDMGDPAVDQYLEGAHCYEQSFDSELHNFKRITDAGLKMVVDRMPNLHTLILTRCGDFTNEGLSYLIKPKLQSFDVADTPFSDDGIAIVRKMKYLHDLNLHNTAVTNEGLQQLASMPLTLLNISNLRHIDDDGCTMISKMQTLRTLSVAQNQQISHGIASLVNLDKLEDLDISNTSASDDDLKPFIKFKGKNLHKLNAGHTYITDVAVEQVISKLDGLHELNLNKTKITGTSLVALAKLKSLRSLHICQCPRVTAEDRDLFRQQAPNCELITTEKPVKPKGYY